jgi:hypothetical protein
MRPTLSHFTKALHAGSMLLFMMLISLVASAGNPESLYDGNIRLNPECKIKRMSTGEVIVMTKNQEGLEVKHQFSDFYADLLMAAYRKQRMEYILESFSRKYYLSEEECRREIKHALNILSEWNIVVRDERMASR